MNKLFLLLWILLLTNTIIAQEKACFICSQSDVEHIDHDHEPPYKEFSFQSELPILAGGLALAVTSQLLKKPAPLSLEEINLLNRNDINSFDRYATFQDSESARKASDIFLSGVLVLPSIFLSNHHTRKDIIPLIAMTGEVILINIAITDITKKLARRTRPLAYNPSFPIEEKMRSNTRASFFSGHTSHTAALSFLIAKVIDDYHPEAKMGIKLGVWTFAASIPAITGYLRVRAGKHFPTDTITGFVMGGLAGVLIPHFHKKKKTLKKVQLNPSLGVGHASLKVQF